MTFFIMLGCGLPDPEMRFVLHLRIQVFAAILIVSGLEPRFGLLRAVSGGRPESYVERFAWVHMREVIE